MIAPCALAETALRRRGSEDARTPDFLDGRTARSHVLVVSDHQRAIHYEGRGYGDASRPEDYIDGFSKFLRENMNGLPALNIVVQRSRDLMRADGAR